MITRLATLSFNQGSFPASYKTASVTPLLKKKDLDPNNPASFRPISNLHTISKVLERLFLSRIGPHVESYQNFNRFQSAYRRGFSTETAILRMLNDVYSAADDRRRSMIVLLDLSAAFDTIDISTLLCRLQHTSGSALLWLKTYLEGRAQYVRVGSDRSSAVSCEFGVPRGSVLGPMLFATYIAPIAGVISSFGIHHTQYADDTQLYIELRDSDTISRLNECFRSVHSWFAENGLALNPDKSEVIVIGTGTRHRKEGGINAVTLRLGDTSIAVSKTVKNLGVTLDETLSFNSHVDNVCKAAHFHIRALRHIRRCIDDETARTVASSMVGARLDYCNYCIVTIVTIVTRLL